MGAVWGFMVEHRFGIAGGFLVAVAVTLFLAGCISVTRPQRDGA